MLATLGDLIDDVVVHVDEPVNIAADTEATIVRRRGGSAANVAAVAAAHHNQTRFLGQVGNDSIGAALVAELAEGGVDTQFVRRRGSTGTIVVLVDDRGERTMLTDRRACMDLDDPLPDWLDGVSTLHVPLYSLAGGAVAATATTLIGWAHERGIAVSIDLSSTSLIRTIGVRDARVLVHELRPTVVFGNRPEADLFGVESLPSRSLVVVKDGPRPAEVRLARADDAATPAVHAVPVMTSLGDWHGDTTGAGDAFAAGFLTTDRWLEAPLDACAAGHAVAGQLLSSRRA